MTLLTSSLLPPSLVTTYLFLCLLSASGMLVVAVDLWQSRPTVAGRVALAMVGCVLGWLLAVILSLLSPTAPLALFWHETVRLAFVMLLPPLIIIYSACYFGVPQLSRRLVVGVGAIPGLTVLLDLTNGLHHWFLASYSVQRVSAYFVRASWAVGPWFPIYGVFVVGSLLVVVVALVLSYRRRASLYRAQVRIFVMAILPPAVLVSFDTFSRAPLALLGLAPLGFAATALFLSRGLHRERMLDLVPVARNAIFASIADPVLVLDGHERIVDLNPAAEQALGWGVDTALGAEIDTLLPQPLAELQARKAGHERAGDVMSLELRHDGQTRSYDMHLSSFGLRTGRVDGHLLVLRDVTAFRQTEERLVEQASQLDAIFESQADGVAVYDLQGRFVRANRALRDLLGFDADADYTALPFEERAQRLLLFDEQSQLVPLEQWPQWRVLRGEILAGASAMEAGVRTLDGRELWISITGAPVRAPDGQATGVVLITRDVTARRALERQVAEQAAELGAIFETQVDGVLVHDAQGNALRVNQAYRDLVGLEAEPDYLSRSLSERKSRVRVRDEQGHPVSAEQSISRRVLHGEVLSGQRARDVQIHTLDGREVWVSMTGAPIRAPDGQITGAVLMARDVTARRALERKAAEQAAEQAAAAERTRLAHELHDTVTQEIFSAGVLAESIARNWREHRAEAEAALAQLPGLIRGALAGLRVLLLELRPTTLDDLPLVALLRQLAEAMSARAKVPIVVSVRLTGSTDAHADGASNSAEPVLPPAVKVALYRMAQEALMNAAKYAKARAISVQLRTHGVRTRDGGSGNGSSMDRSTVELKIADDGCGFDPSAIPAGHFGLAMMRERAQAVGAKLQVRSQLGRGTRIVVAWSSGRSSWSGPTVADDRRASPEGGTT